jgi:hypothetical protein
MDNEQYKILKSRELKRPNSLAYFSVKKIFTEDNEEDYTKYKEFSSLRKKKAVHSAKKVYSSFYQLFDDEDNIHHFHIYRDIDIGFNEFFQKFLINEIMVYDVQTDEETQKYDKESFLNDLNDAIKIFNKKKKNLVNES